MAYHVQVPDFSRDNVQPGYSLIGSHLRSGLYPTVVGRRPPYLFNFYVALSEPPSLIPDHAIHNIISNYTLVSFAKPQHYPPNPQILVHTLLPSLSPLDEKLSSLDQLSQICKRRTNAADR
ncbi:hypothetical protein Salat_0226600 [Sesamum alatum]|uniref:Uncharacterized protein n=1 Tax=Sesamum alatum TaxID=300844 RepID=A0AAE2CYB9_9LAMI|nr:hypothetical protein Salat_0226600 [Sesamum alatum]